MLKLIRFNLLDKSDLNLFIETSIAYYTEICTIEECKEEIADLHNEQLTHELIQQTLQVNIPYFIMKIVVDGTYAGFIAYFVELNIGRGYINNFYVLKQHRGKGIGTLVFKIVEEHIKKLGAIYVELEPVEAAIAFYQKEGYVECTHDSNSKITFRKTIK